MVIGLFKYTNLYTMSESLQPEYEDSDAEWELQYGDTAANVKMRWEVYKYSGLPPIHEVIIDRLIETGLLTRQSAVLDVGCSDGAVLRDLQLRHGHEGPLYGVDPHLNQAWVTQYVLSEQARKGKLVDSTVFIAGKAQDLYPIPDNSQDVVLELFVHYHIPETEQAKAFSELKRVQKPEGATVIATSGQNNKQQHRFFERLIAHELGVLPPRRMNSSFDTVRALEVLPRHYGNVEHMPHHSEIHFTRQNYTVYRDSLLSMTSEYRPRQTPTSVLPIIEEKILPLMLQEIDTREYFSDQQEQDFFICRNKIE